MKKYILLLVSQVICASLIAQVFSVSANKNHVLYIGVDNPLTIRIEKYLPGEIEVTADKGTIFGNNGTIYIYRPIEPGKNSIIVSEKATRKEIGRVFFTVKYVPDPVAKIDTSGGGNISKSILMNQHLLKTEIQNFDFDLVCQPESFTVLIMNMDACTHEEIKNTGNNFNDKTIQAFKNIRENETIIFKDIFVKFPDGRSHFIVPIVFTVAD